ncbi:MAG TPA: hypothetical protein VIH56_05010 [Candidatus Acidoferrales bacterium]
MAIDTQTRPAAARAFVRSLNILLKFARMYDFGHPRTAKQFDTAWIELHTALGSGSENEAGLLLGVSGDQLLLDGSPLDSAAAERSFARMLSAAGIASIHFSPKVTQGSLARFVRGFPTGSGTKPIQLAEQLKAALQGDPDIHVNEVCFVPADSAVARSTVAAQIAAHTLGMSSEKSDELFNDPQKLLQLIMAAEGTKGSGDGPNIGRGKRGSAGSGDGEGDGDGYGSGDAGHRSGSQSGHGDGSAGPGGPGYYAGDGSEIVRGGSSFEGGSNSGNAGPQLSGPVNPVRGSAGGAGNASGDGTWNIVGGEGGGAPLPPDVGGFWFNKDGATQSSTGGAGTGLRVDGGAGIGPGVDGGAPVHSANFDSESRSSDFGTWNIVGGTGQGAPLDPDAGGFWLNKDLSKDSASKRGGTGEKSPSGISVHGTGSLGDGGETEGSGGNIAGGQSENPRRGGGSRNKSGSSARVWKAPGGRGGSEAGEVTRWGNATAGIRGSRSARAGGPGSMAVETGLMTLQEDELKGILQVLAQIARTSETSQDKLDPASFQSRLSTLPRRARFTVSQALSALAAQAPSDVADKPTLLKLAEHIAVRFALESYENGDIEVNAVRQVLDEMSQELDGLRKVLGVYEEKMARHGIEVQSHVDLLAQQFWNQVGDEKKKAVLESAEAWCVPPGKIREYVEGLIQSGDTEGAATILRNYSKCITNKSPEQRRQTAMGLSELASLFAKFDERLLVETIRQVGVQLAEERDSELQSLVGAAFVRLSQEAANKRSYQAIQRSVELVEYVESERPGLGKNLRPRIAIENRLPDFIEESLKTGNVPSGLMDLLRRMPAAASDHIAGRFSRSGFRDDCDLLISMMQVLGPEALQHLRDQLCKGGPAEAIEVLGLLMRMDASIVEEVLPARMSEWKRSTHDRIVRQISSSGAAERGHLLLKLFDDLDSLVRPLAIDEIGMSGEQLSDMRLLRIAEGDLPDGGTEYLQLKAIEALGRLRTAGAEAVLRKIAEARKAFRWASPSELRLVASQAMEKIDPEWVRNFIPRSGLSIAEFSIEPLDADPNSAAIRQRRYPRLRLEHAVSAMTTNLKENWNLVIPEMTLSGGVAICEQSLHPGSVVGLKLNAGKKPVKAQTIVRDANTQARAFEVVDMDLEERAKLRKLLVQLGSAQKQSTPQERTRRTTRTITSSQT